MVSSPGNGRVVGIGPGPTAAADVIAIARHGARVELTGEAERAVAAGRAVVDELAGRTDPHYGVSTGIGALATTRVDPADRTRMQQGILRSHAAGAGPAVEAEVVRAMMALRLSTLATGHTGVRVSTARAYADLLDSGLVPWVPEFGSVGCSGDLAPLSHCALVLTGEGTVVDDDGVQRPAGPALRAAGLEPVVPVEKEGLALVNGTDGMLGMLMLACADLDLLLRNADVTAAMSVEALLGTDAAFAADLQALRPHPGQRASAAALRTLLSGSAIMESHRDPAACTRVQDAYCMRCVPAVHGAARDTLAHAVVVAEREAASAVDNPVVTFDGQVRSSGNFHGAPLAYVLDFMAVAVADVASMAERRTDRLLDPARNQGLPAFLAAEPGVDSGVMITHYTQAALVADLRRLAVPASVDSIPTSAMQEDHVSFGWSAARKLRRALDGLATVLGVEAIAASRALDLRAPLAPAPATAAVRDRIRADVPGPGPDHVMAPDLAAATALVRGGDLVAAADAARV